MPAEQIQQSTVGNYELLHKIAEGGMGAVFKGRHRATGAIVAVKIVPPNLASNQVLLRRFEQEFKAARSLNHPNIVRAVEFGFEDKTPYLIMEFVDGETLGQRIDRLGKVPEQDAINVIAQIAEGLYTAHLRGLVHRDVKPDNILIQPDGVAKLTDMGLVKEVEADLNLTRTGRGLGTPHFMAPEQFRNAKNADARCDVYSLAATLYMAVTGELPFKSCSPLDAWMKKVQNDFPSSKQLNPAVSDHLDQVIRRAMSADPDQRPANCQDFVVELRGQTASRTPSVRAANVAAADQWYLRYRDDVGATHTVKGSLQAIRRCLREGLLGTADNIFVSRLRAGPFEPLLAQAEFRDMQALLPGGGDPPAEEGSRSAHPGANFKSLPRGPSGSLPTGSAFKSTPAPSAFKSTPASSKFKSTPLEGLGAGQLASSSRKSMAVGASKSQIPASSSRLPGASPPQPLAAFRTPQIDIAPVAPKGKKRKKASLMVPLITWLVFLLVLVATMLTGLWVFAPALFGRLLGK